VIETRTVCVEALLEERMVAAVPADHPLAERAELSLADLAEEPFVSIAADAAPGFVNEQTTQFARRGLSPRVAVEAPGPQAQLALVAAGVGVGLHLSASRDLRHTGVALIGLADEAPRQTVALAWRRDDHRELVRTFLDAARTVAERLAPP
jgi:DNA-binding transcriptional LysR family regulator